MSYQRYREARLKGLAACDRQVEARLSLATAEFALAAAENELVNAIHEEQRITDERRAGPLALYARWAEDFKPVTNSAPMAATSEESDG